MTDPDQHEQPSLGFAREIPAPPSESPAALPLPTAPPAENVSTNIGFDPPSDPFPFPEPPRAPAVPPDLDVPWSWGDLALFVVFYFGSIFVLSIVTVIAAAAILHVNLQSMVNSHSVLFVVLSILAQALASLASIAYLRVMVQIRGVELSSHRSEGPWQTLGWRSLGPPANRAGTIFKYVGGGIALALLVSVVSQYVGQRGPVPFEELFKSRQTVLCLMAFGILLAPIVEEMMFRGFLYPVVARRYGIPAGVIVTGILFGAFHAAQLWGAWEQIALLGVVGILLTWVRARSGTILASYIIHVSYNSTLFAGMLLATSGLKNIPVGR